MLITEEFENKSHFFSYLNEAYKDHNVPSLHCFILIPNSNFNLKDLTVAAGNRGLQCKLTEKSKKFYVLSLGIRTSYQIGFLIDLDNCWLFFNDGDISKVKGVVRSFIRNLFPLVTLSYVPSIDLLKMIESIRGRYERISVSEGTLCKEGETLRNWKKEPISFSVSRLQKEAEIEKAKWTGITMIYYLDGKEFIKARIYERGLLTFYFGNFSDFYENLLLSYANKSLEFSNNFDDKERKKIKGEIKLNPIRYQFKRKIPTEELEIMKGLLLKKYVGGVISSGNPFLMIQFTDPKDGSSYDLYAYEDTIEIVPLDKASSASLGELISIISDNFPLGGLVGG